MSPKLQRAIAMAGALGWLGTGARCAWIVVGQNDGVLMAFAATIAFVTTAGVVLAWGYK